MRFSCGFWLQKVFNLFIYQNAVRFVANQRVLFGNSICIQIRSNKNPDSERQVTNLFAKLHPNPVVQERPQHLVIRAIVTEPGGKVRTNIDHWLNFWNETYRRYEVLRGDVDKYFLIFLRRTIFWGCISFRFGFFLQPRTAPVCTGTGADSDSTRFRKKFRRLQSQVTFNRVPEKVLEKVAEKVGVPEKVREKVPKSLGAKPSQVQQGSGEGSGEGRGGFGAEPGQVQQDSEEGSGEGSGRLWCRRFRRRSGWVWCRARSGSKRVPGEGCREGLGKGFGNLWWRARLGPTDSRGFPALGFAARFRKICNNKTLQLLGIPPKLIFGFCSENVPGSLGAKRGQI